MHSRPVTPLRRLGALLAAALVLILIPVAPAAQAREPDPEPGRPAPVAPALTTAAEAATSDDTVQAVVHFDARADLAPVWGDHDAVLAALRGTAGASQQEFEAARPHIEVVNAFWIVNAVLVELPGEAASRQLEEIASLPAVARLGPNLEVEAVEPAESEPLPQATAGDSAAGETTYGIENIQADRAWHELGVDGAGVRVATLDTGIDISHPDLAGKMVTDDPSDPTYPGGWMELDREGQLVSSEPYDTAWHGTHVSGTIHGGDASGTAIGVAPGAALMHGQVLYGDTGTWAQVVAGMQWALDPTDAAGEPAGAPAEVLNMSLGGNGFVEEMIAPTRAVRAAGVFPAFAIGNNCASGGTHSPGNVYESVAVGATDPDDGVAGLSCGGVVSRSDWDGAPADWPDSYVKPDVSAPGVEVYSAIPGDEYMHASGTSMATPHVAGTAALMRAAGPELSVDELAELLEVTAYWDDRYAPAPPDTRFGHGRINAHDATLLASADSGFAGTVTDAATGEPIENATVSVDGTVVTAWSDQTGAYEARVEPGTYDLTVAAFGYEPATLTGLTVRESTFTAVDPELRLGPTGSISGTVTYEVTGNPIPGAVVSLVGTPARTTTGADGGYDLPAVPAGEYEVQVRAEGFPYPRHQPVSVAVGESTVVETAVDAPLDIAFVTIADTREMAYYLDEHGVELTRYSFGAEDDGAQAHLDATAHRVVLYGHWYSFLHPGQELFDEFLDTADANGTGLLFLGNSLSTSGIRTLSRLTGQPETVGGVSAGGGAPAYYEVTAEHPVLDGFEAGDRIVTDEVAPNAHIGWFDGYTGDGREVLADVGRADTGIAGHGIGVEQRENSRHVLLSDHEPSGNRLVPRDWSADAETVFWNALEWAGRAADPAEPQFVPWGLEVAPDEVQAGEPVEVRANVTNVGGAAGSHELTLDLDGEPGEARSVELDPGETATVSWTLSGDALASHTVRVAHLRDDFRVRAPRVSLSASTVEGGGEPVGPLAGAQVELLTAGGDLAPAGRTDADGTLTFETTAPAGEYTVVVRRPAVDGHRNGYLLVRPVEVSDDTELRFAPQADETAIVDLSATGGAAAVSYLRHERTGEYGFGFTPGPVVATTGGYDLRHVHTVEEPERVTWAVSEILPGQRFDRPTRYRQQFGGRASADLAVTRGDGTGFTATWQAEDVHGNPFETVLTGAAPVGLPAVAVLDEVPALLRGAGARETEVLLRIARLGAGGEEAVLSLAWDRREFEGDLADHFGSPVPRGVYRFALAAGAGGYPPGDLRDRAALVLVRD